MKKRIPPSLTYCVHIMFRSVPVYSYLFLLREISGEFIKSETGLLMSLLLLLLAAKARFRKESGCG